MKLGGQEYDYIVIDSPPSLGPLSDASLIGAGNVIVPLLMSEPSVSGFVTRSIPTTKRPIRSCFARQES